MRRISELARVRVDDAKGAAVEMLYVVHGVKAAGAATSLHSYSIVHSTFSGNVTLALAR